MKALLKRLAVELWQRLRYHFFCLVFEDGTWEHTQRAIRIGLFPSDRWLGRDSKIYYWYLDTPENACPQCVTPDVVYEDERWVCDNCGWNSTVDPSSNEQVPDRGGSKNNISPESPKER